MRRTGHAVTALALAGLAVGCGATSGASAGAAPASAPQAPASAHVDNAPTQPAAHPAFRWHTSRVTAHSLGASWHSGCPVPPRKLRAVSMTFWGFDHTAHTGRLVVAKSAVPAVVTAFHRIYHHRFPIRRMHPVSRYDGSDNRSMNHDNTSAFNCRYAVADGAKHWSEHAYGQAVDIDPRENPYVLDGKVRPKSGAPYVNRSNVRPGMIVPGSVPVHAFDAVGWGWGGRWSGSPDYQHFSSTGH